MTSRKRWKDRARCRWCNIWFKRHKPTDRLCSAQCKRLEGRARQAGLTRHQVSSRVLVEGAGLLFTADFWSATRKQMEAGDPIALAFVLGDEFGVWVDLTAIPHDKEAYLREGLLARWNAGETGEE